MYTITASATIDGTTAEAWDLQAAVAGWPRWNSHERDARLDGPFAAGTWGWSKPRGGPPARWVITEATPPGPSTMSSTRCGDTTDRNTAPAAEVAGGVAATGAVASGAVSWSSRSALPGGALTGTRTFTPTEDGRLRCDYTMSATGPLEVLFRLWFGRRIHADMVLGFSELEAEIVRRRSGSGA